MRSNPTLEAEQKKTSYTPYLEVAYWDGASWQSLSNIQEIEYNQEPYGATATIRLNNLDGAYSSLELRGRLIRIGWERFARLGTKFPIRLIFGVLPKI